MIKLIILILFFSNFLVLNAFSDYQEEKIIATDKIEVETKDFCYYEEKVVEYLPKNDFLFAQYDLDDYKIEYGDWQEENDFMDDYEEKTNYYYEDIKEIRYVHLGNNISPDDKFMLNRVIIAYYDQKVDYTVECLQCPNELAYLIKNENAFYEGFFLTEESELIIDLGDYYELQHLTFNMFVSNYEHGGNRFEIWTTRDQNNIFTRSVFWSWFSNNEGEFSWYQRHLLDDAKIIEPSYYEKVMVDELEESTKTRRYFSQTFYQEKIYLYKNYEYQAILTTKEESDYCITKYRYREIAEENDNSKNETKSEENFFLKDNPVKNFAKDWLAEDNKEVKEKENNNEKEISSEKEEKNIIINEEENVSEEKKEESVKSNDNFRNYYIGIGILIIVAVLLRQYVKN